MLNSLTQWWAGATNRTCYNWRPGLPYFIQAFKPEAHKNKSKCFLDKTMVNRVFDQGETGLSVPCAVLTCFGMLHARHTDQGQPKTLNPLILYMMVCQEHQIDWTSNPPLDIRKCIEGFQKLGAPELSWLAISGRPVIDTAHSRIRKRWVNNCLYANEIKKIFSVPRFHFRETLQLGQPIICGLTLFESFESETTKTTGAIVIPHKDEKIIGGLCIVLINYDDQLKKYTFVNCMGTEWGANGLGFVEESYLQKYGTECVTFMLEE